MTISTRSGRRDFLRRAAGTLLSARMLPLALAGCSNDQDPIIPEPEPDLAEEWAAAGASVSDYYDELEAILYVGGLYLDKNTNGRDPEEVDALIRPIIELVDAAASDDEALTALTVAIADDFGARDTQLLDGWVFASAELQLAGLLRAVADLPESEAA